MAGAICTLLILGFQAAAPDADPAKLVAQLGSIKYAERQAAAEALEHLGRVALPALRLARDSKDLEIKTRTVALIRKIEGAMLTQPTMLRFDFKDAPLSDVVKSLSEQSGIKIGIFPESIPRSNLQKITLSFPEPIPFWKGIDMLCAVANLRPNPGMVAVGSGREPTFALVAGGAQPILPTWDHGPFRVSLTRLHSERDVSFGGAMPAFSPPLPNRSPDLNPAPGPAGSIPKPTPIVNVQFNFHLQISGEPRLSLSQSGQIQMTEAIDDQGNSLAMSGPGADQPLMANRFSRQVGGMSGQMVQLAVPLKRPDSPGSTIKVLKGAIPLLVTSRRPDPLVIPLSDASGKSFENRENAVTVHGVRKNPNQTQTSIDLSIRAVNESNPIVRTDPNIPQESFSPRPDIPQQQIEVIDRNGRPLTWFQSTVDPESSRMTMTLNQFGPGIEPKEIRIYSLTKAVTNVPFEFRDMPMP